MKITIRFVLFARLILEDCKKITKEMKWIIDYFDYL